MHSALVEKVGYTDCTKIRCVSMNLKADLKQTLDKSIKSAIV